MAWEKNRDTLLAEAAMADAIPARGRKSKTGRWCRGKVGVPHILEHDEYIGPREDGGYNWDIHRDHCGRCGKRFVYDGEACRAT